MSKETKIILAFILPIWSICALFVLYAWITNNIPFRNYLEYTVKPYQQSINLTYDTTCNYEDIQEIRADINDLVGESFYIYKEAMLPSGIAGQTNITFRTITMNDLWLQNKDMYTLALTHELVHLKYFTANECFTQYKAITTLYESGNDYFKNVALKMANTIINTCGQDEYDCGYYLLEYFKE